MPKASTLTLLVGSEALLVERALSEVIRDAREADPDVERHDVDAAEVGAIGELDQACSPTLFGGGVVVVVTNCESASQEFVTSLITHAHDMEANVPIVVSHPGGAKGKKVLAELAPVAAVQIDCAEIKKGRGVQDFVTQELRRQGRSMTPQAQSLLLAAVGSDIRELASACAQLASDVDSREIDTEDVSLYFGGTVDVTGFQISDAVLNRQGAQALRLMRLAEGVDGGGRLGPATVAALVNAIRQLVAVAGAPPGLSERDLAVRAKVPPWKLRTINSQLRRWNQRDLAAAILLLADLDAAMKGGLRDGEQLEPAQKGLALERAVVSMAT